MNYRHAFHAGNFADVLKHAVMALALKRMTMKPKPMRVIDTHAGIGSYRLDAREALKTGEWHAGIGRLLGPAAQPIPSAIADLLAPYLDAVRVGNPGAELNAYPGSPALALALLRPGDRLVANELHPVDCEQLRANLRSDRRAKVLSMDGWQALRVLLPPPERRGLILIDPPFEDPREYENVLQGLTEAIKRFATGTYMLWLPVKDPRQIASFRTALRNLGLPKLLWVELHTQTLATADGLTGTAMAIINPPFELDGQLRVLLPFLADRLATGPGSSWQVTPL